MSHNNLVIIPKEIEQLSKLRVLNVSNNKLTSIPAPVCRLSKLRSLDVSHNLIKKLPKQLALSPTVDLIMNGNRLENIDYSLIINIEKLVINNNKVKNFNPNIILPKLKYLWIKDNPCTDEWERVSIMRSLPNLKKCYPSIHQNNPEPEKILK